ncbi:unnamed protein product [Chrysoparadoxa australica]
MATDAQKGQRWRDRRNAPGDAAGSPRGRTPTMEEIEAAEALRVQAQLARKEDDGWEWAHLLPRNQRHQLAELEAARRNVDAMTIRENKAKFAVDTEAAAAFARDVVVAASMREVNAKDLVKLLRVNDGSEDDGGKNSASPLEHVFRSLKTLYCNIYYKFTMTAIAVLSCALYVLETYFDEPDFKKLEWLLLFIFLFDFIIGASFSKAAAAAPVKTLLLGICAILPSPIYISTLHTMGWLRLLTLGDRITQSAGKAYDNIHGGNNSSAKPTTLPFSAQYYRETLRREGLSFATFLLSSVIVSAGILNMLDQAWSWNESDVEEVGGIALHQAIYVVLLTFSTVGLGGYNGASPELEGAKWALLLTACAFFIMLPWRAYHVFHAVKEREEYDGAYHSQDIREELVVICGSITYAHLRDALYELFHADHGQMVPWVRVVILCEDEPSNRLKALLQTPAFRFRVAYLKGSPLQHSDLIRAGVREARSVLVLVKPQPISDEAEDMKMMMQSLSVLTHTQRLRMEGGGPSLLVELISPSSARHLRAAGIPHVFSKQELQMGLIAQSFLCPGWSCLVANLVRSRPQLPPPVLEAGSWLTEYYCGSVKSFYFVQFATAFLGMTFSETAALIYEKFELTLIAVEVHSTGKVLVGGMGGSYVITGKDRAFVLAETEDETKALCMYMAGATQEEDHSAESEEAALIETLQVSDSKKMTNQGYIESFEAALSLSRCRKRLGAGTSPSPDIINLWNGKFSGVVEQGPPTYMTEKELAKIDISSVDPNDVLTTAAHLKNHVVVVGIPALASLLEAFIRPLRQSSFNPTLMPTIVFMNRDIEAVGIALQRLRQTTSRVPSRYLNLERVYLLKGSPLSYMDLKNAGLRTASGVACLSYSGAGRRERALAAQAQGVSHEVMEDGEAVLFFVKSNGLVRRDALVLVEMQHDDSLRYLHTGAESAVLSRMPGNYSFLWSKYASGRILCPSMLDSLSSQAFYRPSRIMLMEALLKLAPGFAPNYGLITAKVGDERHAGYSVSSFDETRHGGPRPRRVYSESSDSSGEDSKDNYDDDDDDDDMEGSAPARPVRRLSSRMEMQGMMQPYVHQLPIPSSFVGHSYGELFQHLVAPPLHCIAFGLYRARGTRNAPEAYVYTGPRADTVLHRGDKVFVVGSHNAQLSYNQTTGDWV